MREPMGAKVPGLKPRNSTSSNVAAVVSRIQHCATASRRYMLYTVVVANTALVVRSKAKGLKYSCVVSCLLCFDCPTRLFPDVSCSSCNNGKPLKKKYNRLTSNILLSLESDLTLSFFSGGGSSLSLMMC